MIGPFPLIVPTGVLQNSSDVFAILDPDSGGAATFKVALSADGSQPATHWGAYTYLQEETHNALTTMNTQQFKAHLDTVAEERGRNQLASATAFKNSLEIGQRGQNFWQFAASLGLQPVDFGGP